MNKPSDKFVLVCTGVFLSLIIIYIIAKFVFKFDANDLSTLTNFFVASATFIAAGTALILYNNWRDEKNYELKKELVNNIINTIDKNYYEIIKLSAILSMLDSIDKQYILINDDRLHPKTINYSTDFSIIYSKLNLYNIFFKVDFHDEFRLFESYFMTLNNENNILTKNYKEYYKNIPSNITEKFNGGIIQVKMETIPNTNIRDNINLFKESFKKSLKVNYSGKNPINYDKKYKEILKNFQDIHDSIIKKLANELHKLND
ncbi:hypothetical protein [Acinetobacter sp. ANC 5502]